MEISLKHKKAIHRQSRFKRLGKCHRATWRPAADSFIGADAVKLSPQKQPLV